jgi:hypothetical protein
VRVKIKRYLVLVCVLVGMGIGTVWLKSRTLAMGYEVVRLEKRLVRANEEVSLEDSLIARMLAPNHVRTKVSELGLGERGGNRAAAKRRGRRGETGGRSSIAARR